MRTHILKMILIGAAVIRFSLLAAAWNSPQRLRTADSQDYRQLCQSLSRDYAFQLDGRPETFRTPGYPFFLTFGELFGDSWWRAAAIVQIGLDVLLVYLTFLLGALLCSRQVALWAAAFQAVAAISIVSSLRILSDGLFAVMLTMAVLLLASHFRTSARWSLLSAAVFAGLACYVRAVGLVFCGLATLVLLFRPRRLASAGAFAGVALACITPWVVRNVVVADYWGFSSFASDSMYHYSAPAVLASVRGDDPQGVLAEMADREHEYRQSLSRQEQTEGRLARYRCRQAIKTIRGHPATYAGIHLRGSLAFWLPGVTDVLEVLGITTGQQGTLDVLHAEGLRAAIRHYIGDKTWAIALCAPAAAVLLAEYALAAICAAARVRLPVGAAGWLILLTVLALALIGGPANTPRFRVPVAPLLSLAAGAGAVLLIDRTRRRKRPAGPERAVATCS